jgi:hypothetical protein
MRDLSHRPIADSLTEEQKILLVYIMEEACEVGQAAAKILRFGEVDDRRKLLIGEWEQLVDSMDRYIKAEGK